MNLSEYFIYYFVPFKKKTLIFCSMFCSFILSFIETKIGLSFGILAVYFILTLLDTITGVYKNCLLRQQEFKSSLFFKKLFSICLMLISFVCITMINEHLSTISTTELIKNTNIYIKYLFNLTKIFLLISFISYEFISIRENCVEIGLKDAVKIIDIILYPITLIRNKIINKIKIDE